MRNKLFVGLFFLALFIAGCADLPIDTNQTFSFYEGEAWEVESVIGLPPDVVLLFESLDNVNATLDEDASTSSADLDLPLEETVKNDLTEAEMELAEHDIDLSWDVATDSEGFMTVSFTAKGEGYANIGEVGFLFEDVTDITVQEVDGIQQITFVQTHTVGQGENVVTVRGGEIIGTNGTEVEPGVVQWVNPDGRTEVTLTPGQRSSGTLLVVVLLVFICGLLLVGVVGVAGFVVWQRQKKAV